MDAPQASSSEPIFVSEGPSAADPRLQPTPDYGTLGPGSDIAAQGLTPSSQPAPRAKAPRFGPVLAIIFGVLVAVFVANIGKAYAAWSRFANLFAASATSARPGRKVTRPLDSLNAQKQAEVLLEQAVAHSDGAVDQISTSIDSWQGKLQWDSQIATLTTAALNSNDMRVRQSGVEVELAAYGLAKNSTSLNYLIRTSHSSNHAQKIWALWALGLMGNRSVETDRVIAVLTAHLKDSDEDSRRWAAEGLGLVGSSETLATLLQTMHDDPSPAVRERAACSLAESGMFTQEQRVSTIPKLLTYTDDPSLDAQTRAWAFQALGDITHQHLAHDSAAWRTWYESTRAD